VTLSFVLLSSTIVLIIVTLFMIHMKLQAEALQEAKERSKINES